MRRHCRRIDAVDLPEPISNKLFFDTIVEQAMGHGLIGGRVFYIDSLHPNASANKNKYDFHQITQKPVHYLEELNAAINDDRAAHGKKPLSDHDDDDEPPSKEVKISPVDPDAGFMVREGKPTGFSYLDHHTVDGVNSIITDTHITADNVHDSGPYLDRLDHMREGFGFDVGAVGLDAG